MEADELFSTGNYAKIRYCTRLEDRPLPHGPMAQRAWSLYQDFAARSFRPRAA
jgi:branched-chain amino acid aminotransferase